MNSTLGSVVPLAMFYLSKVSAMESEDCPRSVLEAVSSSCWSFFFSTTPSSCSTSTFRLVDATSRSNNITVNHFQLVPGLQPLTLYAIGPPFPISWSIDIEYSHWSNIWCCWCWIFLQSMGFYLQHLVQLGFHTDAFEQLGPSFGASDRGRAVSWDGEYPELEYSEYLFLIKFILIRYWTLWSTRCEIFWSLICKIF